MKRYHSRLGHNITLFTFIIMSCGTDNIMQYILHIHTECEKYFAEHCQPHRTLLWI